MQDFFTQEDREELEKSGSKYLDLQEGNNKLRIVSGFVKGYKFNFENQELNKELGYPFYAADSAEVKEYGNKLQKTFVMIVWDYKDSELKIAKIHQKGILNDLKDYMDNPLFGEPTKYDIIIKKDVSGKTKYSVVANPPTETNKEIKEALEATEISLDEVFRTNK